MLYQWIGQVWVSRSLGQGQGHMMKSDNITYFNMLILYYMVTGTLMRSRSQIKSEGHIKVNSKNIYDPFQFYAKFYLFQHIIRNCVWLQVIK